MIMFRLASNIAFSIGRGYSFGDKSHPSDFKDIQIGFIRIIIPTKEESFSKFFKMYLNEDYQWHPRIRSELKKERSKLRASYKQSKDEELNNYISRNRELQNEVNTLKEDVKSLVRSAEVIDKHQPVTRTNSQAD